MAEVVGLEGRVALVTGSRRGIGRLLTEHLLGRHMTVVGFARGEASIDHPRYSHYQVDISDPGEVQEAFAKLAQSSKSLHILINNAGVATSMHAMMMSPSSADAMLRTNLLGSYMVSREAAKLMRKSKWGRIINIGSMAAKLEPVGGSIYAVTKAGLSTLANVLAKELATFGITCNTINVTAIETDMLNGLSAEWVRSTLELLPLPRLATPDDLFNVVDFLISERSSYITAQTIGLGGIH